MAYRRPLPDPGVTERRLAAPAARAGQRRHRGVEDWLLLLLAAEKCVQHAFVTWAFADNRFDLRDHMANPWEPLLVIGGASGVLFLVAMGGLWRWRA